MRLLISGKDRNLLNFALVEIDRVRAAGVRFGCVLADAGYGLSASFRQGLSERGLVWAVGHPLQAEGLSGRRDDDLSGRRARPPAKALCPGHGVGQRAGDAVRDALADAGLAARDEGVPEGPLRCKARACLRRSATGDRRHGRPASAWRGGLVDRRTSLKWRAQVLSLELACRHLAHAPGRRDQGALDL